MTYTVRHLVTIALAYHRLSSSYEAYLSTIAKATEPRSFHEACHQTVWQKAMHEELQALDDNHTWSIISLPKNKKVVGSRWVYKIKFKSNGSIETH